MTDTPVTHENDADDDESQYTETRFYRLSDPLRDLEFDGVLVAWTTTEDPSLPRWTTMHLYRTVDGRYVYYRVGHSLVYHDPETDVCRSGVLTGPEGLPEDAEPCTKCRPPLEPTGPVNLEESLRALFVCDDVPSVIQSLVRTRNGGSTLSRPAQRLLADAAIRDEKFRAHRRVERL